MRRWGPTGWFIFIEHDQYKELGAEYPFTVRYAVDKVSTEIIPWLPEPDESEGGRVVRWRQPETSCDDILREEKAIGIRDVICGRPAKNTKRKLGFWEPRHNPWDNKKCKPRNGKMRRASEGVL